MYITPLDSMEESYLSIVFIFRIIALTEVNEQTADYMVKRLLLEKVLRNN